MAGEERGGGGVGSQRSKKNVGMVDLQRRGMIKRRAKRRRRMRVTIHREGKRKRRGSRFAR